jgi:hypothetical protein
MKLQTALLLMIALITGLNARVLADDFHDRQHDRIDAAADALKDAQQELINASSDFHGHKHDAMIKIDEAIKILEESRSHHVDRAVDKIDEANQSLRACVDGDHPGDHPNIHRAIKALDIAKEQL